MHIFHDSRDGAYRSPAGAQPCGARVRIRLRVTDGAPDSVLLRLWYGRESFLPMRRQPRTLRCMKPGWKRPRSRACSGTTFRYGPRASFIGTATPKTAWAEKARPCMAKRAPFR